MFENDSRTKKKTRSIALLVLSCSIGLSACSQTHLPSSNRNFSLITNPALEPAERKQTDLSGPFSISENNKKNQSDSSRKRRRTESTKNRAGDHQNQTQEELAVDDLSLSNPADIDSDFTQTGLYGAKAGLTDPDLNFPKMLTYAVQDEYLAHAVYDGILEKWGKYPPYDRIIHAESQHLSALQSLYEAYHLPFPADDSARHVSWPADRSDAARIGVEAEKENIAMYERFLKENLPADVKEVFIRLKNASVHHLAAFERQVAKNGKG